VTLAVSPRSGGSRLVVTERLLVASASAVTAAGWAWRLDLLLFHTGCLARV
jgi:hypothetical protein